MANHKSARKKARKDEERRVRNRFWRARLRSQIRLYRESIAAGDRGQAGRLLNPILGLVDRTARAGVIHDNTAARTKSRLQAAYNKVLAG